MLSLVAEDESDAGTQLSVEWQRREQLSRQSELIDELLSLTQRLQNSLEHIVRDLRRRARRKLHELSDLSSLRFETSMGPIVRALLISLFAAAFWPLLARIFHELAR